MAHGGKHSVAVFVALVLFVVSVYEATLPPDACCLCMMGVRAPITRDLNHIRTASVFFNTGARPLSACPDQLHCFIVYCIYCIVLLHRLLLHIAIWDSLSGLPDISNTRTRTSCRLCVWLSVCTGSFVVVRASQWLKFAAVQQSVCMYVCITVNNNPPFFSIQSACGHGELFGSKPRCLYQNCACMCMFQILRSH